MITTLNNEKFTASVGSLGAQLVFLRGVFGREYIWQRDPAFRKNCSPLLLPIVGNCRDGKTCIEGIWYETPKHGFCKDTDFKVSAQSSTSTYLSVIPTKKTKEVYPYGSELSLTCALNDNGLLMDYMIGNPGTRDIARCIGTHPGSVMPPENGEKFSDYHLEFEQEEQIEGIVYDLESHQFDMNRHLPLLNGTNILPPEYSLFDNDVIFLQDLKSRKISVVNPATRKGVEVDYRDFKAMTF